MIMNMKEYYQKEIAERKKIREIMCLYRELENYKDELAEKIKILITMLEEYKEKFLWGCAKTRLQKIVTEVIICLKNFNNPLAVRFLIHWIDEDDGNIFSFSSVMGFNRGNYNEKILLLLAERKLGQRGKLAFNVITDADKKGRPVIKFKKLTCDNCMLSYNYHMPCPAAYPKKCLGYKK